MASPSTESTPSAPAAPLPIPKVMNIVHHPAAVLRERCKPVEAITPDIERIVARMIEVMRKEKGIGLAAPQVGVPLRIFIVDVPEDPGDPEEDEPPRRANVDPAEATKGVVAYINPVLSKPSKACEVIEEGCLSLPNIRGRVNRPISVTMDALGLDGKPIHQNGTSLLARCWQHEMDHLDGVLIIDRMLQADRIKNRKKLKTLQEPDDE